jgi:hypothetical protein
MSPIPSPIRPGIPPKPETLRLALIPRQITQIARSCLRRPRCPRLRRGETPGTKPGPRPRAEPQRITVAIATVIAFRIVTRAQRQQDPEPAGQHMPVLGQQS